MKRIYVGRVIEKSERLENLGEFAVFVESKENGDYRIGLHLSQLAMYIAGAVSCEPPENVSLINGITTLAAQQHPSITYVPLEKNTLEELIDLGRLNYTPCDFCKNS